MKKRKNIKRKNKRRKSGNTRLKRKTRITKRSKCILAVLCAVLLVVTTAFAIAQGNTPRRSPNVLLNMDKDVACGVDLSHFNGEVDFEALTFLSYVTEGNEAVYTYYHDDGYEKDYENPAHLSEIRILPDGTVQR